MTGSDARHAHELAGPTGSTAGEAVRTTRVEPAGADDEPGPVGAAGSQQHPPTGSTMQQHPSRLISAIRPPTIPAEADE